mgnify:CR=1 FL=1
MIKKLLKFFNYQLTQISVTSNSNLQLVKSLENFNIDLLFDIGANTGQFAEEILNDTIHSSKMANQIQLYKFLSKFKEYLSKKELMNLEFQMNMQLKGLETQGKKEEANSREDRKDERTKIQATQQSELINQRQNDSLPKDFESAGMDNLGGFGLEQFDPR